MNESSRTHDLTIALTSKERAAVVHELGPESKGALVVPGLINTLHLIDIVEQEIDNPQAIQWRDNHQSHINERGLQIDENYNALALKLHHGDRMPVMRIPLLRRLTVAVENLIRYDLSQDFPALRDWYADEMTLHDYDPGQTGISRHRDHSRFWGVIAIATLRGEADFHAGSSQPVRVVAGDIAFLRGPGLYEAPAGTEVRPEHAVGNVGDDRRVSLMIRANNMPDTRFRDYVYDNWPDPDFND